MTRPWAIIGKRRAPVPLKEDRLTVARLLAERGPIPGADAAVLLGWSLERWWRAVGDCGGKTLYEITGRGCVVTPQGRELAEGSR